MAGVTAQGASFSFIGASSDGSTASFVGSVVGISVDMPKAEVVNMTAATDALGYQYLVPTGEVSGGTITIDFLSAADPQPMIRKVGTLRFASGSLNIGRRVVCESANIGVQTGELVRGSITFAITDWTGT